MRSILRACSVVALAAAACSGSTSMRMNTDLAGLDLAGADLSTVSSGDGGARACGAQTCAINQYCFQGCCGAAGCTPPAPTCIEPSIEGGCAAMPPTCACIGAPPPDQCSETNGLVTVTQVGCP